MKTKIVALLIAILSVSNAWAIEPVANIIEQAGVPLKITSYSAAYQEGSRYSTEGIRHSVEYTNISEKTIVAIQITLVSFDIWNEFMDRTGGISMDNIAPGGSKKGTWVARAYADFSFLTGFAYVSKARYADGTIWEADLETVAKEMQKIEKNFDVEKLKGKPEKK